MSTLKQKSVDGIIWNLTEKFGIQFIKLILGVILARLLTPADYGLIGMITVFFVVANVFVDSGFGLAYIQKKDADETDASTIFFFNLIVSIILYLLLWFTASLIANFYEQTQLIDLVRVMGLILIINSFSIIQIAKLTKEVDFKKKTIILLISSVIGGGAGISAALLNYGVWSLVIQGVVNASIKTLGLWIAYKWKPLFVFNLNSIKSLFSFSSWALLISIIGTIFDNIYILVIGKFFPAAELGFYTKARGFQRMVSQQTSSAIGAVAFPVFSQLQDEKLRLKNAMRKFSQHTLFFVAPISAILIVIAKPLFLVLLTEKWLPMVPYFQLLLIAGALYPIHMVNVQVLSAQGKINLTFRLEMLKNSLRVVNIIIMYRFGVIYIIIGEIILSFFALIINTYYTKRMINYGIMKQLKDISCIIVASLLMALPCLFFIQSVDNIFIKILFGALIPGITYLLILKILNKHLLKSNFDLIKNKILQIN